MPAIPASQPPQIHVVAEQADTHSLTAQKLMVEWYPRINVLLYGPEHPLPYSALRVQVDPSLKYEGALAYAEDGAIHLLAGYIAQQDEADFEGMVIHELTHLNQVVTKDVGDSGWVLEGLADYVRHKYFEKDIAPTLHLTADGRLKGYKPQELGFYGLQEARIDLTAQGYQKRYVVAATFLYWLEVRKDQRIVHELSAALEQGTFTPALFEKACGKPLDALWDEFVAESKRTTSA